MPAKMAMLSRYDHEGRRANLVCHAWCAAGPPNKDPQGQVSGQVRVLHIFGHLLLISGTDRRPPFQKAERFCTQLESATKGSGLGLGAAKLSNTGGRH